LCVTIEYCLDRLLAGPVAQQPSWKSAHRPLRQG
jgi:hypothetical protein